MKVLDSTVLIDVIRGDDKALQLINGNEPLLTTQLNMYEVICGLFIKGLFSKVFIEIKDLFENIHVLPLNDSGIIRSAEISGDLQKKGRPISDIDCLTAGIALSSGADTIITRNVKHFERIQNIKVESY